MATERSGGASRLRAASRFVLWLHAGLWVLFAGGMTALGVVSPESRGDVVFVQVTLAAIVAMAGSLAAALGRPSGVAAALLGGLAVIAVWTLGDSGRELRFVVAVMLGMFAVAVMTERRAAVRPSER